MKNIWIYFAALLLYSCGSSSDSITNDNDGDTISLEVNSCIVPTSDEKLEIVTWNIEHFPKTTSTIAAVAKFIEQMDVDVIAMQEISNKAAFDYLLKMLPSGWKGHISKRTDLNLAYVYKTSEISLNKAPYAILKGESALPRAPFVLPIHSKSTNSDVIIINNHFKAYGDGISTAKRKTASKLLKNWIDKNHPNDKVVVLGDLNDEITDAASDNVFQIFLDDAKNYYFTDSEIALASNRKNWSYPGFPSHIDHILITNELFNDVDTTYTYVFGKCSSSYRSMVSDHYPVCVVLK